MLILKVPLKNSTAHLRNSLAVCMVVLALVSLQKLSECLSINKYMLTNHFTPTNENNKTFS